MTESTVWLTQSSWGEDPLEGSALFSTQTQGVLAAFTWPGCELVRLSYNHLHLGETHGVNLKSFLDSTRPLLSSLVSEHQVVYRDYPNEVGLER